MSRSTDIGRNTDLLLADILAREARGGDKERSISRATVLAVDVDGGKLQNPSAAGKFDVRLADGSKKTYPASIGPSNPAGSIKARILTAGIDQLRDDADVRVFWPLLPQDQIGIPISPGEHVYVFFEGEGMEHGLWISRVSGHESANSFAGATSYTAPNSQQTAMDSFEDNGPEYQKDDSYAGQAPQASAMTAFEDD